MHTTTLGVVSALRRFRLVALAMRHGLDREVAGALVNDMLRLRLDGTAPFSSARAAIEMRRRYAADAIGGLDVDCLARELSAEVDGR